MILLSLRIKAIEFEILKNRRKSPRFLFENECATTSKIEREIAGAASVIQSRTCEARTLIRANRHAIRMKTFGLNDRRGASSCSSVFFFLFFLHRPQAFLSVFFFCVCM